MVSDLKVPTLVIRASESDMFAPETLDKTKAANPRVTGIEIAGSHDLAGDNPDGSHRRRARLPRGKRAVIEKIEIERCTGCGICDAVCPADVIHMEPVPVARRSPA